VSDKLANDDDDGTRRGDNVPLGARSGASRDLRFLHGSPRLFHAASLDGPRSVLCFSLFSDDAEANFLAPNTRRPRRLPGVLSGSLLGGFVSTSGLEADGLISDDDAARCDFLSTIRFSLLLDVDDVRSPGTEFERLGFLADFRGGRTGFLHTRLLHTHTDTQAITTTITTLTIITTPP